MSQGAQQSSQKPAQGAAAQGSKSPGTSTKPQHGQPKRSDLIFHLFKASKLVGSVMKDRRVPVVRKVAYVGIVGFMLTVLLFPEALGDFAALIAFFPADILGIPAEGVFDWAAFAVATFELLKLFPKEIVGEHYDRLFRR